MARRALIGGALALPIAALAGFAAGGPGAAASAALGVGVVAVNFAVHGWSLAWAAGVSLPAVQAVALGGLVLRMGVVVGMLFALDRTAFFSPLAFGLALVPATLALLAYEARLLARGLGGDLDVPPDPAAVAAHDRLRAAEEVR